MRSGHASRTRLAHGALAWAAVLFCASLAAAQPHVACVEPANPELAARIRGQTRDLPLRLSYVSAQLGANPTPEQLHALAKQHAAQLVVQVTPLPGGAHVVRVYDPERRELRKRSAPAPSRRERWSRSAAAETIALIVRGELSDVLRARAAEPGPASDSTLAQTRSGPSEGAANKLGPSGSAANGDSSSRAAPTPATSVDTPAAPPQRDAESRAQPAPPERDAASRTQPAPLPAAELLSTSPPSTSGSGSLALDSIALGLGMRLSYAAPSRLFAAPLVSVALRFTHIAVGISASTSLSDEARAETLTIWLREHAVAAELALRLPLGSQWELSAGPTAGALLHSRTVLSPDPSWELRRQHTSSSAVLGLRAALRFVLSSHLSVSLRGGFDYMLRPLHFAVAPRSDPDAPRDVAELNALQPLADLALYVDF